MNLVIGSLACLLYVLCFSLSITLSIYNYPCHLVYGCAWVLFIHSRWVMNCLWFSITMEDLENPVKKAIGPGVYHGLVMQLQGFEGWVR